jgi:hypothetical protein
VIHDISFPTAKIGYAAAELGQVWKTTNGGANEVVISGLDDSTFEGIIRWSQDGGTTWINDIVLTTTGWS